MKDIILISSAILTVLAISYTIEWIDNIIDPTEKNDTFMLL
jgi:hypothetical protein